MWLNNLKLLEHRKSCFLFKSIHFAAHYTSACTLLPGVAAPASGLL
jgi:hypothetical protein